VLGSVLLGTHAIASANKTERLLIAVRDLAAGTDLAESDVNYADVLGKKPVVVLFASPALCVSRTCGPVADVTEQVKQQFGDKVGRIDASGSSSLSAFSVPAVRGFPRTRPTKRTSAAIPLFLRVHSSFSPLWIAQSRPREPEFRSRRIGRVTPMAPETTPAYSSPYG